MSIRILLVDDHRIFRQGLRALLAGDISIEIIGEAADGRQAVALAQQLHPDVVVMDVVMPKLNGVLATQQILSDRPRVKVVALSMHSQGRYVAEMLAAGAAAYLLKTCSLEELTHAINVAYSGQKYLSADITSEVVKHYVNGTSAMDTATATELTGRELEVLQLLAEGETSKQIAATLHVSVKTVTAHRQNIVHKLSIHSVAGLTKYAVRTGLTSLDG